MKQSLKTMEQNKKQTPVALLINEMKNRWVPDTVIIKNKTDWNKYVKFIKEVYKEHIFAAHRAGQESAYGFKDKETAEEYYAKTYE